MVGILLALVIHLQVVPNPPSFHIFGPGPVFNVFQGDEGADTNAIAHVWFGVACPMVGHVYGGKKGMMVAGATCASLVVVREVFFHGNTPGPELRTDMVSQLGTIGVTLFLDWLLHDHR